MCHVCRCACVHVQVCMCACAMCACVHVPCVQVCMCACAGMHVCMCHVCRCACVQVPCVQVCMCAGVHVCRCACVHVHVCMCRCACVHVPCVHVCRCACVYVHVHVCMCACACVQQQNSNTNTQTITSLQCVYNYIKRNILKWTTESVPVRYMSCEAPLLYDEVTCAHLSAHCFPSHRNKHAGWTLPLESLSWPSGTPSLRSGSKRNHATRTRWDATRLFVSETPPGCLLVRHHQVVC